MALTTNQISINSACWDCLDSFTQDQIFLLLLARWVGGSTDPQTLATASVPFAPIKGRQAEAAISYLLNRINGGTSTPNAATTSAACFSCFPSGRFRAINNYLLNSIVSPTDTPATLAAAAKGFRAIPSEYMKTIIIYLLAQKAALTLAALLAGYPCWQCGSTQQNSAIQSFFFLTLASNPTPPAGDCVIFPDTILSSLQYNGFTTTPCLQFPNLTRVFPGVSSSISTNAALASVTFGVQFSPFPQLHIESNPVLKTVTFSGGFLIPQNTIMSFTGNALTQATVDAILAQCVAANTVFCTLALEGGTNATPSAAGLANKAILVGARGWTVTNNP